MHHSLLRRLETSSDFNSINFSSIRRNVSLSYSNPDNAIVDIPAPDGYRSVPHHAIHMVFQLAVEGGPKLLSNDFQCTKWQTLKPSEN
mmetsp:Transcript_22338/g.47332  ORF Transcript_22338/g.47332 Transcript_22338/m.47332 type:complete len:88 (-) Transcript_22338:166-429(-)